MGLSHADEVRAYQTYLEARDSYIPKLAVGSDIGYAHGFPLSLEGSAPTLFNVTTQSSVWNPALRDFIKAAKPGNPGMQFASTSFAGPNVLMRALGKDGAGVAISQVVPPVTNKSIPVVSEYMVAFEKLTGKQNFGATSLESFIAAKVLVEGLRRAGPHPTRDKLRDALETLRHYDIGGLEVTFTSTSHTGLDYADLSIIGSDGKFQR